MNRIRMGGGLGVVSVKFIWSIQRVKGICLGCGMLCFSTGYFTIEIVCI